MKVKLEKLVLKKTTRFGTVEKVHGHARVMIDAEEGAGWQQAGWVPIDKDDPFAGVFHPLSGFPEELCQAVVDGHEAITRSLRAPPGPATILDDTEELDAV